MTDLFLHERQLHTVFDLLGDAENDITYSVGWALSQSPAFCASFIEAVFPKKQTEEVLAIRLQHHGKDKGYTDVEIVANNAHIIVEAKRGWNLPLSIQLERYAARFKTSVRQKALVVIAECSAEYVRGKLPTRVGSTPVLYLSWKQVAQLADHSRQRATYTEKHLLEELNGYLRGLMSMQDQESNLVFTVVLGTGSPEWAKITWKDFVTEKRSYFHPLGIAGWPAIPPNYLGFRYQGKLLSIHHVSYEIVEDFAPHFPKEIDRRKWAKVKNADTYVLYKLGPAIYPPHEVKNGNIYGTARLFVALDLLLTCKTIEAAYNQTKKRLGKVK